MYVIEILNSKDKCWIAKGNDGDPPRTLVFDSAQKFKSLKLAKERISKVEKTHPFRAMKYKIVKITNY